MWCAYKDFNFSKHKIKYFSSAHFTTISCGSAKFVHSQLIKMYWWTKIVHRIKYVATPWNKSLKEGDVRFAQEETTTAMVYCTDVVT